MKILQIADLHGKDVWKKIVERHPDADKIVFTGDYWDSFDISFERQKWNFQDVIEFKQKEGDRVVLLTGNHDFHYFRECLAVGEKYSGFQTAKAHLITLEIEPHRGILQMAFSHENFLFTHAGVTQTFINNVGLVDSANIAKDLNDLFAAKPLSFVFEGYDSYGDDVTQGPLWVRPRSLEADMLPSWIHIVGHTRVRKIVNVKDVIYLTDTLEEKVGGQYTIIENKEVKVYNV
ncbi:MAG TPA: metallophosphoesterase [Candidatus Dojkabacteria bacterium]|nr:metallophosphoesterase [Candidatus Dojkabacteria bacterium]